MHNFYKRFLLPAALLSGAIIGAGIFALPAIFSRAGLAAGFIYLGIGGLLYAFLHLLYADVILKTPGDHRFVGYARTYLGKFAGRVAALTTGMGMIFTLTIYLVLSLSFINLMTSAGSDILKISLFWIVASLGMFLNLRRVAFSEFVITLAKFGIVGLLFLLGIKAFFSGHIATHLPEGFSVWLMPLAPILFAMSGRVAIPSIVKYFRISHDGHDYKGIQRAVVWGTITPMIVYGFFVLGVLGITPMASEDTITGLRLAVSAETLMLVGLLGLLSLWGSYIAVGIDAMASLTYDFKMSKIVRGALVIAVPIILYMLGFTNFITLVGFVGGVFLGLEGLFILTIWMRARKVVGSKLFGRTHPFLVFAFGALLLIAMCYETYAFFI